MTSTVTNLPSVQTAPLPRTYEAAKQALAECSRLDECKSWSDKAAAVASYARQINDDDLMKRAMQIKARAVRRSGELLKEIEPARGANQNIRAGTDPNVVTRNDIARNAGMSDRQRKAALRVATIPEDDFNAQVESDNPPSITRLAEQGIKPRPVLDLKGRDPSEFNRAMHFVGEFEHIAKTLDEMEIGKCCEALTGKERDRLRTAIGRIGSLTDQIRGRL
ncbi:MAG: hypothetical protein GY832_35145 [Chloroflexi bacterium]|nr:hypothetical protein [Chloroflexota bacterium]